MAGESHSKLPPKPSRWIPIFFALILATIRFLILLRHLPILARRHGLRLGFVVLSGRLAPYLPLDFIHYLMPTTGENIRAWCREKDITTSSITMQISRYPSAKLHFIPRDTEARGPVLLYLHGGGYVSPGTKGMIQLAYRLKQEFGCQSLAFLEYSLAPEAPYPIQLAQVVATVQWLLEDHLPDDLILGGDSAGASLALGLLAHIHSPHPSIDTLSIGTNFRGVFAISPRCSHSVHYDSYTRNAKYDVASKELVKMVNRNWKPQREVWSEVIAGGSEVWGKRKNIPARKLLVIAGENEVYIDGVREWLNLLPQCEDIVYEELQGQIHDQVVMEREAEGLVVDELMKWGKSLRKD